MPQATKKISAKDIMNDIRARMTDSDLIAKYKLSPEELQVVFRKLLDAEVLSPFEFQAWSIFCNKTVPLKHVRLFRRDRVNFPLPIYEADEPENRGKVVDISANGLGVTGIEAVVDDIKTFVIPTDELLGLPPLVFEARCIWIAQNGTEEGRSKGGFYLIDASAKIWQELRRYIREQTGTSPPN
ncbi:MAG: PilZ domain-containing protein [Desulfomonile tiedjei]|nr:PilZ domain-containing protein [Desulfomonile tiedjei]